MALKIKLKPHERLIIGGAVVANGDAKCDLIIENEVPVLRDKDILREKEATTPCKRIYFVIQLMYVDGRDLVEKHNIYWSLVKDLVEAAPSTADTLAEISGLIIEGRYYPALKLARKLIEYEEGVTEHVLGAQCL
ncbi:MAG: flagellar biosynthesis repressor FlbT [Syntrophorhabdus sp. PtaB.Bin184]|jgi:flagellar protein FlbT|nr:MAG: flagellar biosynthesis repressor FlbT [Syntrophorhabdus sp. PtaB.Bin184]